jgi:hypothetical protein
MGFKSQDSLIVFTLIDQFESQSFGQGNIQKRVVFVKNVLRPDIAVNKFLFEVSGGLPCLSEVKVHLVEYFHVSLL